MMAIRRLSSKHRQPEKEENFTDLRGSETTGVAPSTEKKSFLQRAFGFISSDTTNNNGISDPEDEDVEAGYTSNRSSRSYNQKSQNNNATTTTTSGPLSPSSKQQQQQPPPQPPPPPPRQQPPQPPPPPPKTIITGLNTDVNPPRPHTANPTSPKKLPISKQNQPQQKKPQQPQQQQSEDANEEMKRRHSIATSRSLANEAMAVAKSRNISLTEKVQNSKIQLNQSTGLSYDNIYPSERSITGSDEEVVETNDQIMGLNRHRESELQRISMISKSSSNQNYSDDSEDEKVDHFDASNTNKNINNRNSSMRKNNVNNNNNNTNSSQIRPPKPIQNNKVPATNLRGLLAQPTPTPTLTSSALTTNDETSFNEIPNYEELVPDSSAQALERRRRSTRFPSIKGKREMFLLRSETGSSVSSASSNSGSAQPTLMTKRSSQTNGNDSTIGDNSSGNMSSISHTSPVTVESALSRRISRKYVTAASNIDDFNEQVTHFYAYNELKRDPVKKDSPNNENTIKFPPDVNPKHREQYLSDTEFEAIFNMSKSAFNSQPKWKRQELKKQHNLF